MPALTNYVLIGSKDDECANCLTIKQKARSTLKRHNKIEPSEIKKEFKAPSWEVARIVYENYNGWIPDLDQFIKDLTKYVELEKVNVKMGRNNRRNKPPIFKG